MHKENILHHQNLHIDLFSNYRTQAFRLAFAKSKKPLIADAVFSMLFDEHVCTDGRTYPGHRDPPGQGSVYIPPGDERQESYRGFTFNYSQTSFPVSTARLATAGFYYTGFRDRVKCFSCGLCVENWNQGDDEMDRRWHKTDCAFADGIDTENKPIPSFTRFLRTTPPRRQSPSPQGNHLPELSQNGSRQIEISSGNYVQGQIPHELQNHNQLPQEQARSSSPNSSERSRELLYPCNHSVNPHFSSVIMRLESFKPRNGIRWPSEKLRAGIDDLVNAGFFFLGEGDRVKCWYCNGGLQNWDYEDDPFTEHAKWFPSCEYVLRVKGSAFVENIVEQFPNLRRPTPTIVRPSIQRQAPPEPRPVSPPISRSSNSPRRMSVSPPRQTNPPQANTPPMSADEAVEQAMANLQYVQVAKNMGMEERLIKDVLKRKYEANNQFYHSSEEFLEALFAAQQREDTTQPSQSQLPPAEESASAAGEESMSMMSQLQQLEESRLCRLCKKEPSNMVLIPCGHLSSCDNCINSIRKCPICHRTVQDSIKAFRA